MATSMRRCTWGIYSFAKCHVLPSLLQKQGKLSGVRRCSSTCGERWQLVSAVCLERPPVVTAELTPFEQKYASCLENVELEQSLLSDHELWHQDDLALAIRRKSDDYEETEAEAMHVTAVETEDAYDAELATFTPAPRLTVVDQSGDETTTDRLLDRRLVLLVKQRLGNADHWVLPQGPRMDGETMREAAERVLTEMCGNDIKARFLGNAPVGFYKYRFPLDKTQANQVGAKVFFFKAQLEGGQINLINDHISAFSWSTKEQMIKITNSDYRQNIKKFILEL